MNLKLIEKTCGILPNLQKCRDEISEILDELPIPNKFSLQEIISKFKEKRNGKVILNFENYTKACLRFATGYNESLLFRVINYNTNLSLLN